MKNGEKTCDKSMFHVSHYRCFHSSLADFVVLQFQTKCEYTRFSLFMKLVGESIVSVVNVKSVSRSVSVHQSDSDNCEHAINLE